MIRKLLPGIALLLMMPLLIRAQPATRELDSLHFSLHHAKDDTARLIGFSALSGYYDDFSLDSSLYYSNQALAIAVRFDWKMVEANILAGLCWPLGKMGNYPLALKSLSRAYDIASNPSYEKSYNLWPGETPHNIRMKVLAGVYLSYCGLYIYVGDYAKAKVSGFESLKICESLKDTLGMADVYGTVNEAYYKSGQADTALTLSVISLAYYKKGQYKKYIANLYLLMGEIYRSRNAIAEARENFGEAIRAGSLYNNPVQKGEAHIQMAGLYLALQKPDSALYHGYKAQEVLGVSAKDKSLVRVYRIISDGYRQLDRKDSSFNYLQKATWLKDKLDSIEKEKIREFQAAGFEETLRLQQLEKERIQTQSRVRTYSLLAGLFVLAVTGFILYRNSRQNQKAKLKIEKAYAQLQSTQAQLIQSEKMASLGELTAGIAHEIQNPLNFVNNFSELSNELIEEMNAGLNKGEIEEAKAISADIKQNLEKINHHGKRAEAIVRGMLQHSRAGSGQKEPTDINVLCEEYLRLAYHGLRAKDKSFNAIMKTDFDSTIGKVNIIPQDIGRVVLNLITNAFYAVNEKSKLGQAGYEPTIEVKTLLSSSPGRGVGGGVSIFVKDNGAGIPPHILDKIFQPFFTTKPTGQGTGLGLSLSYDIVTKGHGGELLVESQEGKYTQFTMILPL